MSIADRNAQTVWQGSLARGSGEVGNSSSGALDGLALTWASRTEQPGGKTSPEELIAAAHSSCFSMALSLKLGERKVEPERLEVSATVSLSEVDGAPTISDSKLRVRARLKGLTADEFATVVDEAAKLCPVSRALAGVKIAIDAALDTAPVAG